MRLTGTCWSCATGLSATFLQGIWASDIDHRSDRRQDSNKVDRNSNTRPKLGQKVVNEYSNERSRKSQAGQLVEGLAPTPRPTQTQSSRTETLHPQITPGPALFRRKYGSMRWDALQDGFLAKRADESCPTSYQLCASSLGGGCCPQDGYSCGTSSCLPSSASSASACGFAGYVACDIADGGGCCPTNYICAKESCSPSPGVASLTCGSNSIQCPASLGGGCCPSGMGCALSACYNTTPIIFTFTDIITTTDSASHTLTLTSTITSTTISGSPNPTQTVGVFQPKIEGSATAIAKSSPTNASSGGGGLSTAALGGIIGGAIFFLSAILIASIFIIRGLNRASKAQEAANSRASGSGSQPHSSGHRPSHSQDVDTMSIDPLIMTSAGSTTSRLRGSGVSTPLTPLPEMEGSPNGFVSPASPPTMHPRNWNGYNPLSTSSSTGSPPAPGNPNDYFDIPNYRDRHHQSLSSSPHHNGNRVSIISSTGRPSHGRNFSNSSDVSQSSDGGGMVELDATPPTKGIQRFMSKFSSRGTKRGRADSGSSGLVSPKEMPSGGGFGGMSAGGSNGGKGLGFITEAGESRLHIEGSGNAGGGGMTQLQDVSLMDQPPGFRMR